MVRASAGSVETGKVEGFDVVAVGPDDSQGDWLQIGSGGWDAAIGRGSFSAEVHDVNGRRGTVEGLYCQWDWCNYGSNIDWENQTVKNFEGNDISFSGDRLAIVGEGGNLPDGWDEVDSLDSLELNASIINDIPSSLCSGASTQVEVGLTQQSGLATISGTVEFINNIDGSTSSESFSVDPTAGTKRTFTLEIPREVTSYDGSPATVRVTSNADNTPIEIDVDISIGANPDMIDASGLSVSSGNNLCVGSRLEPSLTVTNNAECEAPINVALTESVTDSMETQTETVSSGLSSDISFRKEIPPQTEQGSTVTYTADVSSGDTLIATKELEVSVGSASFDFIGATAPTAVCTGSEFTIEAEAANNGNCEGRARLRVTNPDTGLDTIVSSDSVRVGSSIDMRFDRTIPGDLSSLDTTTYTVELQERLQGEFRTIASDDVEIEIDSPSISLNTIEAPDSVCPGQQYTLNAQYSNEGGCEGRVRIQATGKASGETSNSSPEGVRANSSSSRNFTFTVPTDESIENKGQFDVEVSAQVPAPDGGWQDIASMTETIGVDNRVIALNNFSAPSDVCVGEEFSVDVVLENNGNCPADARVSIQNPERGTSSTTDPSTVQPTSNQSYSVTEVLPVSLVDQKQVNLELSFQYRAGGDFVEFDSTELSVTPNTFDLGFESVSIAESACAGRSAQVEFTVNNSGKCSTTAVVEAVNQQTGDVTEISAESIDSETTASGTGNIPVPVSLADSENLGVELNVYGLRGDDRLQQDSSTETVEVLTSELGAVGTTYPENQKPGARSSQITVENNGSCNTNVTVVAGDSEFNSEIDAGSDVTFTHEYDVGTSGAEFTVEVSDDVLGEQVFSEQINISAHRYASLDTMEGQFTIVGGFEEEAPYRGTISGSNVEGADNLEETDRVLVANAAGTFRGTITNNKDTIQFSSIQYLDVAVTQPVVWVVNGEVKEESRSFRYKTLASEALSLNEKLGLDHTPEVDVKGNVRNNFGALRRQLGVSKSPASIRVFRSLSD